MEIELYGKLEDLARLLKDIGWEIELSQINLSACHPRNRKLGLDAIYNPSGEIACDMTPECYIFYNGNIRPKLWTYNLVEAEIKSKRKFSQKSVIFLYLAVALILIFLISLYFLL